MPRANDLRWGTCPHCNQIAGSVGATDYDQRAYEEWIALPSDTKVASRPSAQTLTKQIAMAAEIMGQRMSREAIAFMATELMHSDPALVSSALKRCAREVKGRLTLADVTERLGAA